MILTKKHLNILENIFDNKMDSIDSLEILNDDKDYLYYVQLVQMGLLKEDEDHFSLTYPGMMLMEAYRMAQYEGIMPDINQYDDNFRFVGSEIINMLYTAELAKDKVNDIIRPKLEKRGMVVDGKLSEFGKKVLEVYEELEPYFYVNKPLQEFLKKTNPGPAHKRNLLDADKFQILESEALRMLAFSAPDGLYYNLTGVGQQVRAALLKGAFFRPITQEYFEALFELINGGEIDPELKEDLVAQAVITEEGELLPAGNHLVRAGDLYFHGYYDDPMSIDIDELEFDVLKTVQEIQEKSKQNPEYIATKENIKNELITKKFKQAQKLQEEYGRRLKELPKLKQKYVTELENVKSEEEWFNKVYDFDAALFGMQGFQLLETDLNKDGKMYYKLTDDGEKVISYLKDNPREISAESVKAITITRHPFLSPDARWIEKAQKAKTIENAPTPTGRFMVELAYNNKTPNLTRYGWEILRKLPYTTGIYLSEMESSMKDFDREELIQLLEKLDARGMVNIMPNDLITLTEAGIKVKHATSGLAGKIKYPVTPHVIDVLRALLQVGSLYVKERKVRILPDNWKKALKLLKMDLETFEDTLTLMRRAGYIGKDSITENGVLLIEAAEILEGIENEWTEIDV
jgi:hypothetical protein